jgi:hypothetical protein
VYISEESEKVTASNSIIFEAAVIIVIEPSPKSRDESYKQTSVPIERQSRSRDPPVRMDNSVEFAAPIPTAPFKSNDPPKTLKSATEAPTASVRDVL